MATNTKKTKTDTAKKMDTAAKVKDTAVKETPTPEATKETSTPKGGETTGGETTAGETTGAAPSNYSRGEGQKPVTAAYKENWNVIFGRRTRRTRRTLRRRSDREEVMQTERRVWIRRPSRSAPEDASYKKLCGSTSISSLIEPFGFGPAASQSRK